MPDWLEAINEGAPSGLAPGESPLSSLDAETLRFDPDLDVSPFELFRALRDGDPLLLIDLGEPGSPSLAGAMREPADLASLARGSNLVLFDRDGSRGRRRAGELRARGLQARALYGGLDLYAFALDPLVVGDERFLTPPLQEAPPPTGPATARSRPRRSDGRR